MIRKIYFGLVLFCVSSYSLGFEIDKSENIEYVLDVNRLEHGLQTGDFGCHGYCLQPDLPEMNWSSVITAFSSLENLSQKEKHLTYCIGVYLASKQSYIEIEELNKTSRITNEEYLELMADEAEIAKLTHIPCVGFLGKVQAENLRSEITHR